MRHARLLRVLPAGLAVSLSIGCGDAGETSGSTTTTTTTETTTTTGSTSSTTTSDTTTSTTFTPKPPQAEKDLCAAKTLDPWARKTVDAGGAVTIDEVQFHPRANPDLEWIEIANPLGIDVDVSGFRLDGAVTFTFPNGTFLPARGFLVIAKDAAALNQSAGKNVAIGSYAGSLPDDGGTIELWNNFGRRIDAMTYAAVEPWPVIPGGSGATLAKRSPGLPSDLGESWTASAQVLGTPGAANFPSGAGTSPVLSLVPLDATWRYFATGASPGADWVQPAFDDSAWSSGEATFYATNEAPMPVTTTATITADNFFALYTGKADGTGMKLIGRDSVGDWTSAESFQVQVAPDDHVFIAAWEAPGNDGGPQSLIGQIALPDGTIVPTSPSTFQWVLGPTNASPGGSLADPSPPVATVKSIASAATAAQAWLAPLVSADASSPPWGGALAGVFAPGTQFIWGDTFNSVSASNSENTYVLFRSKLPVIPPKGATELPLGPTTTYFRTKLTVPSDVDIVQPWVDALVDDGAVIYLNGQEIARINMPPGNPGPATLASGAVGDAALSPGILVNPAAVTPGEGVLAVEVHQATAGDPDMTFAAALSSSATKKSASSMPFGLAFHEVAGGASPAFFVELRNEASTPIDATGYVLGSTAGGEVTLPAKTLAPGEIWLLGEAELGFSAKTGDAVFLYAPDEKSVIDGIHVVDVPRARPEQGPGGWQYPDASTPGEPNVLATSDAIVIDEIMYHAPPVKAPDGSTVKSTLEWIELTNRSDAPVDVGGYQLVDAVKFEIPAGTVLAPGAELVIASDVAAMKLAYPSLASAGPDVLLGDFKGSLADSGDALVLLDACGNTADEVRYLDGGRWPEEADGGGSSLELRDARADNSAGEAWAASDEGSKSAWQTIEYQGVAAPSSVGPDGTWQELVMGMLDDGVALVDDLHVLEDPNGAATELVAGGDFESGGGAFRILGNHRHSEVIVDPTSPGNHVLRLVATGSTEHMHNHVETTLTGGKTIQNGKTYRISFRAKWISGSNRLNTRLYFNRLARTTELPVPGENGSPGAPNGQAETNIGPTYRDLRHAPVVPKPYEPVVVSVVAEDPDGVAGLTLYRSVDSGPAESAPMTAVGGGLYTALVPGVAASSVVQIWVEGADAQGAMSAFPKRGPESRALYQVDDGLPGAGGLHDLRIVMTPADRDWLFTEVNLMSNDRLGATIVDDEQEAIYDAGVRLKSSERGRPETARVGFALRFPPDRPFRGIFGDLMVDRSEGIGYGQRELLFNQAMNHAGTVTSHYDDLVRIRAPLPQLTGPAQLQLARFGDLLLDEQFPNGGDGVVFEYELIYFPYTTDDGTPQGFKLPQPDGVVGTNIQDLGDDPEAYRLPFIVKNNRWRDDYRGLIAFAKVFGLQGAAFHAQVADVCDVDEWLRAFAFATLSGAIDNYASGAQHNGNLYVRPSDGRVLYFPHDLDFYGGSAQSPIVANGDLAKLVADPVLFRLYYSHLHDILTTSYNSQYMTYWADHLGALLPQQDFAGHLQFISARSDWVMNGAPDAVTKAIPQIAFQITTNGGAALTVQSSMVTLDGLGWIDIDGARRVAPDSPVALAWVGKTAWKATFSLGCGANPIELQAFDRHGQQVGSDSIVVTRTGAGCP